MKRSRNVVAFPLDRASPSKNPGCRRDEPAVVVVFPVIRVERVAAPPRRRRRRAPPCPSCDAPAPGNVCPTCGLVATGAGLIDYEGSMKRFWESQAKRDG